MSAFFQAQNRLERALERLEKALEERADELTSDSGKEQALMSDVKGLRTECDQLRAKLAGSNKRYARMQSVVDEVATRLDTTIAELDTMLER